MQEWIQQNHILSIVLRDSLHQPQYVEKLEKILRFVIKEKALTMQDLDNIWAAQVSRAPQTEPTKRVKLKGCARHVDGGVAQYDYTTQNIVCVCVFLFFLCKQKTSIN